MKNFGHGGSPPAPRVPGGKLDEMSDRKSATDVAVATRPRSQHARESALRQDALHIQICDRVRAWPKDRRNEMQQSWTRTWIMNEHEGVRVSPGNICSAGSMVGPPPRPQANRTQSHAAKSISAPQPRRRRVASMRARVDRAPVGVDAVHWPDPLRPDARPGAGRGVAHA